MMHDALARHVRRQTSVACRYLAVFSLLVVTVAAITGSSQPALAEGGLESQKGGLFQRKGFIWPEIHRRKEQPKKAVRVASRTSTTPTTSTTTTRSRNTTAKARPAKRRLPRRAVKRRETKVARSASKPKKPVRVASLTQTVPSSNSSTSTSKPKSVTGGSARVRWVANSRCIPARLRSAIYHVARTYGRVRVNSTCRSRRHNRRVGGASRSYHLKGMAADIRIFGNIRAAARYLRSIAGGYKHYGGGLFHIDTGPKRSW